MLHRSLLLALLFLSSSTLALAFTLPQLGLGAVLFKPPGTKTLPSNGNADTLTEAADFFTDAFWSAKIGGGVKELAPKQRTSLLNSQMMEFRRRYGIKYGPSGNEAELIVARNHRNEIMGCCGIEVDKIPERNLQGRILTKAPLMSNVAVGKKFRRRGVAEDMVYSAEQMARKEWGYDEMYLYVEQRNAPAVRLYQKMGYRVLWKDDAATTLVPLASGGLQQAPTTLVCMRKTLGRGGMLGRFFGNS